MKRGWSVPFFFLVGLLTLGEWAARKGEEKKYEKIWQWPTKNGPAPVSRTSLLQRIRKGCGIKNIPSLFWTSSIGKPGGEPGK